MKDSNEVAIFNAAFAQLLKLSDGRLETIVEKYNAGDTDIKKAVSALQSVDLALTLSEIQNPEMFMSPVSVTFLRNLRSYQEFYAETINSNFLSLSSSKTNKLEARSDSCGWKKRYPSAKTETEADWLSADAMADDYVVWVSSLIQYVKLKHETDQNNGVLDEWQLSEIQDGLDTLTSILVEHIDVRQLYRRVHLVPRILIPTHVASRSSPSERTDITASNVTGLMNYLREVQKAFLNGSDFGALMLLRSLVEITLRSNYPSARVGSDLKEMIDFCSEFPVEVPKEALHRLRKVSNDLVHEGSQKRTRSIISNPKKFEIEFISFLKMVQHLIESAPT